MAFDVAAFGIDEEQVPAEWALKRLDCLASLNPEQVSAAYPHSQIVYLDIANVTAGAYGEPLALSLADAPSRAKRVVRDRDTILSTVRPGNRAFAFVRSAPDNLVASTGFAVLRAKPDADPRFVYYLATSNPIITYLASIAEEKTAYPSVNPEDIAECTVPVPPRDEQRAIAHILGTLDDKIELNRRMGETLEAMARALFKSWFVDFDPVRAKAEGRDTGLPKPLADLFPARFVDSELGEIPEDWEVGTLADLSMLNPEVWSKQTRPLRINYVDLSNTKWGRIEAATEHAAADAPSPAQRVLRPGDTIVGTVRPGNGSYALVSEGGLTGSTGFAVLRPSTPQCAQFVYLAATAAESIDALAHLADGGAYPAVSPVVVAATPVVLPGEGLLSSFSRLAGALLAKIACNERQSRTLAAVRDALLPKLISGELRVTDAERVVASTVQ